SRIEVRRTLRARAVAHLRRVADARRATHSVDRLDVGVADASQVVARILSIAQAVWAATARGAAPAVCVDADFRHDVAMILRADIIVVALRVAGAGDGRVT